MMGRKTGGQRMTLDKEGKSRHVSTLTPGKFLFMLACVAARFEEQNSMMSRPTRRETSRAAVQSFRSSWELGQKCISSAAKKVLLMETADSHAQKVGEARTSSNTWLYVSGLAMFSPLHFAMQSRASSNWKKSSKSPGISPPTGTGKTRGKRHISFLLLFAKSSWRRGEYASELRPRSKKKRTKDSTSGSGINFIANRE